MPEDIEPRTPQEINLETYKASFWKTSPGHQDKDGNIMPEYIEEEIRNKIALIPSQLYLETKYKERDMPERSLGIGEEAMVDIGINEIRSRFPGRDEEIASYMRENQDLEAHIDRLFPPKEEK